MSSLLETVHEGLSKASLEFIALLQNLQEKSKQANDDLKLARNERNKQLTTELLAHIENFKVQENIVRHLADTNSLSNATRAASYYERRSLHGDRRQYIYLILILNQL